MQRLHHTSLTTQHTQRYDVSLHTRTPEPGTLKLQVPLVRVRTALAASQAPHERHSGGPVGSETSGVASEDAFGVWKRKMQTASTAKEGVELPKTEAEIVSLEKSSAVQNS